jgi:hypothetical protein
VRVKRLEREFASDGLPVINYEQEKKKSMRVITAYESDGSDHESEEPIEGSETLNLNSSIQAKSMKSTSQPRQSGANWIVTSDMSRGKQQDYHHHHNKVRYPEFEL